MSWHYIPHATFFSLPCTCTKIINDPDPDLNKCKAQIHKCVCTSIVMHVYKDIVCRCHYTDHHCSCAALIVRKDIPSFEHWPCLAGDHLCQCDFLARKGTSGKVRKCEATYCQK